MAIQAVAGAGATELDALSVNTIRMLAVDAVQKAKSGHPGAPMGMAPMAYVLWTRFLKHNPLDPGWPDRDRFVLSAGHASMLLYALLHLTGYDLSLEEIKNFRQWGSLTPGHPEVGLTPGVETTTGPLGQGFANGVGMAIAERHLAARFNRPGQDVVDHYTYAIVSDGDLQEGVASEAASLAGRLKLGKLIYLYDSNGIQIEGSTELAFTERVDLRFEAYGWHVQRVEDGNDLDAIENAIRQAQADTERPSLIIVTTTIAYGSPNKSGTASAHGEPLGEDEVRATKEAMGWPLEPDFLIPEEALVHLRGAQQDGPRRQAEWDALLQRYAIDHPEDAAAFAQWMEGGLPEGWDEELPSFKPEDGAVATRAASGKLLAALAGRVENLIGGSADLAPSNQTYLKEYPDLAPPDYAGRNLRFGVREHAMGSISNGIALHGGLIPYAGTFLIFSDYMRPAIRLAALSHARVVFVFSHESIGLGEDGPTHQPIEQVMSLRLIPGLVVMRPADATETAEAWRYALQRHGPTAILLTRQGLPVFDRTSLGEAAGVQRGAYVLAREPGDRLDLVLMGSGSEVSLLMEARDRLSGRGVAARVVSMPSWELFDLQPQRYRDSVLPPRVTARLAVEAGVPVGWCRYVGDRGSVLGIDRFGASAPAKVIFDKLGFTPERVAQEGLRLLGR